MKKVIVCGFLIFSGICFSQYKSPTAAFTVFLFFFVLSGVAVQDWETKIISDRWILAILLLAVCSVFTMPEVSCTSRVVGMLCVSVPMLVLTVLVPGTLGGGDIKLMAAGGLFLGWRYTVLAAVLAVLLGSIYGLWLLFVKQKERESTFAFGPFLCAGMAAALLWGDKMIAWFLG